jgi:FAD/FMN-containing dehydrogenase
VVKSVAGFDIHRLLVGSGGRLFLATRLHLRLRPKPPATVWFQNGDLDEGAAIQLVQRLRHQPQAPRALQLQRDEQGRCEVRGRLGGRPAFIREQLRSLGLREAPAKWLDHLPPPLLGEVLSGNILPSTLATLLTAAPAGSTLLWHGGGRFELGTTSTGATDRVIEMLPELKVQALVIHGGNQRRGIGTLPDSGADRLMQGLKKALDPHGILI